MASPPTATSNTVTSGPPRKAILRLAIPTVAAMLFQSFVNEIDIFFFGRLPCPESSNAQGALLPSLILLWAFGGSLSAISVGTQAYTGRRFAERDYDRAGAVLTNAGLFALVAGIVFSGLGYLTAPLLIDFLPHEGVRLAAAGYLRWRLLGIVSMAMTFALKAFFDGIGKTYVHFVSSLVMNILNVVCCVLFIFGNETLGIRKYGMEGAGLAGFISTYVGLLVMIVFALLPANRDRFRPFDRKKIDLGLIGQIVKLSWPSAVATIAIMTGVGLFSYIAALLDQRFPAGVVSAVCPGGADEPVYSAATTVIGGVLKLTFTACLAFGTSTATLVTQSLGEKKADQAEGFGWASVKLGLLIFGVVGALQAIFAPQIIGFLNHSDVVREVAVRPMQIMGVITPMIAVGMIMTQALFGAGNTRFVMVVELILHFGCFVPLAYLFGIVMEGRLVGIWSAAVVYAFFLCVVMVWKFRRGDWKTIAI